MRLLRNYKLYKIENPLFQLKTYAYQKSPGMWSSLGGPHLWSRNKLSTCFCLKRTEISRPGLCTDLHYLGKGLAFLYIEMYTLHVLTVNRLFMQTVTYFVDVLSIVVLYFILSLVHNIDYRLNRNILQLASI
jgi:hypothetical protein